MAYPKLLTSEMRVILIQLKAFQFIKFKKDLLKICYLLDIMQAVEKLVVTRPVGFIRLPKFLA